MGRSRLEDRIEEFLAEAEPDDSEDAERWRQVVAKAHEGVSDGQLADHVRGLINGATPDAAPLDLVGDGELRIDVKPGDWHPSGIPSQ